MTDVSSLLLRMQQLLQIHPGDSADWIASLLELGRTDQAALYRELNSRRMWGGAGSIASQALADNPGMDARSWHMHIREFREIMIALAAHLQARGNEYPDISSWLMAFSNWNQSEV